MSPAALIAVGIVGFWLATQATAGRLPARLLSRRDIRPGEVPTPDAPGGDLTAGAVSSSAPFEATGDLSWPVHCPVTQEFGHNGHPGIDLACPSGTPVHAAKGGTVTSASMNSGGYGNLVVIDHGGGISTAYAHLSVILAHQGQQVNAGTVIGLEGSTGNSTGPHVHFEVRTSAGTVNPRSKVSGSP